MPGKMIVFEGSEGSGKSTAVKLCKELLLKNNIDCISTREPGGTPLAEELRSLAKRDWNESFAPETELMLMYASRLQLLENTIKPALEQNKYVVSDRSDWSSQAYQGAGRGLSTDTLEKLRSITLKGFEPDLVIYLDVDPIEGIRRARGRGKLDRIEKQNIDFFKRVRQGYLNLCETTNNSVIIDANREMNKVHEQVNAVVTNFINS